MADFIVKLEGVELKDDVRAALAREIQALTLRELAKLDLHPDYSVRIPRREWLGIWIEQARLPKALPKLTVQSS